MVDALIDFKYLFLSNSTNKSINPQGMNNLWSAFWYTKSVIFITIFKYYCFIYGCCLMKMANLPNIYDCNI
jgi:hypothetical protein